MLPWTDDNFLHYQSQFEQAAQWVGHPIHSAHFYLEPSDTDFTEQPNAFGKSLFSGIDLQVGLSQYAIGNRFVDGPYGLKIDPGTTDTYEWIEPEKNRVQYPHLAIQDKALQQVRLYWMPIPWCGAVGFYPQEIECIADSAYLLLSSIEVNAGAVNTPFTNELLLIECPAMAQGLGLGRWGNDRCYFESFEALYQADTKQK